MLSASDAEFKVSQEINETTMSIFFNCPALAWLKREHLLRDITFVRQIANCSTKKEIKMKIEYKRNEFSKKR